MPIEIVFETHCLSEDNERGIATGWLPGRLSACIPPPAPANPPRTVPARSPVRDDHQPRPSRAFVLPPSRIMHPQEINCTHRKTSLLLTARYTTPVEQQLSWGTNRTDSKRSCGVHASLPGVLKGHTLHHVPAWCYFASSPTFQPGAMLKSTSGKAVRMASHA